MDTLRGPSAFVRVHHPEPHAYLCCMCERVHSYHLMKMCAIQYIRFHWLLCTWLNARAKRKEEQNSFLCFEKMVLSRFSLKEHTQENEKQNWYFIKKKKPPHLRCCWFIYVMESHLSSSLLPWIKQKTTSSDKLCFSSAPLLCCGSLSSENTLTQLSLSIDHSTVTGDRKQRQPITWIATKPKSQPRMVLLVVVCLHI